MESTSTRRHARGGRLGQQPARDQPALPLLSPTAATVQLWRARVHTHPTSEVAGYVLAPPRMWLTLIPLNDIVRLLRTDSDTTTGMDAFGTARQLARELYKLVYNYR
eukprot:COSAG02_NODE_2527_length_8604_cov_4.945209_4_plen_107_part_00